MVSFMPLIKSKFVWAKSKHPLFEGSKSKLNKIVRPEEEIK